MRLRTLIVGSALLAASLALRAQAPTSGDWPQWRGVNRDGISAETGLLKEWPRTGPAVVWSAADLGGGYGSVSVRGDRVYVQGSKNRQSVVTSLNRADGKVVWVRPLGPAGTNDRGSGPRG